MRAELIWGQEVLTRHSHQQRHKGHGPQPTAPQGNPAVTQHREPHPHRRNRQKLPKRRDLDTLGTQGASRHSRAGRPSSAHLPRRPPSAQKTSLSTSESTETRQSNPAHDRTKLETSNQNMCEQGAGVENQNNEILNNTSAKGEVTSQTQMQFALNEKGKKKQTRKNPKINTSTMFGMPVKQRPEGSSQH